MPEVDEGSSDHAIQAARQTLAGTAVDASITAARLREAVSEGTVPPALGAAMAARLDDLAARIRSEGFSDVDSLPE
ncbi:hypothetical protein ATK36_0679 [Amycolatopsis sulphurea]|uniref:Uncharacterized protein n=1 Tax=Amycolatopsis sulphurea TaxID=76022 RepID=A0A2A9G2T9_9PSEU|nr:hypothetical protein ATK36_0679 [Amycolatopsis sulphurea]